MGAVAAQISVLEYLKTVYRPDRDYVDGVVEERNLGERDHSYIQANLTGFFYSHFKTTGLFAFPEWRFQVKPTRFRVPDVIVTRGKPDEQILTEPPLLCIEILSPEDTVTRTNQRIREYLDFGVPAVWLVDPAEKTVTVYQLNAIEILRGGAVRVNGTSLDVPLSEIFD